MNSMAFFLSIKRKEVLMHVTTWMNLKNAMLGERSHSQKAIYCMIHLCETHKRGKYIEAKNR